ncbi:MAG: IS1634 family transposase [Limnochordia bacterium]
MDSFSPASAFGAFDLPSGYLSSTVPLLRDLQECQRHMHTQIEEKYGRNTKTIYYDVTNFYFEIDHEDGFRRFAFEKNRRPDPIIQMGLAVDADGIPLQFDLFPGNTVDKQTFRPVIGEVRRNYDTGRIIVVADMGINTGDNIYYLLGGDKGTRFNGYVFSMSVRRGTKELKDYILSEEGYVDSNGNAPRSDQSR